MSKKVQCLYKEDVKGLPIAEEFASNCVFYPGHNRSGFRIDYGELYVLFDNSLRRLRAEQQSRCSGQNMIAQAVVATICSYMCRDAFSAAKIMRLDTQSAIRLVDGNRISAERARKRLFYDKEAEPRIVDIEEYRAGLACTEIAAITHNLLCRLGVQNWFYTGYYSEVAGKEIVHESRRHCFVFYRDEGGELKICDPNAVDDVSLAVELPSIGRNGEARANVRGRLLTYKVDKEALRQLQQKAAH